jgi:hypothetical protein
VTDDDVTPVMHLPERRSKKLLTLLDAAREVAELTASGSRLRAIAVQDLLDAAITWGAEECPICGRRGDHEWEELTSNQRVAHEAEADARGL